MSLLLTDQERKKKLEERQRLDRFSRLLDYATDRKLWRGGQPGREAEEWLREAHLLATQGLPEPWPEVAAYRLAHLLMRAGEIPLETLEEVDQLLKQAQEAPSLGIYPLAYRLAVLHRFNRRTEAEAIFRTARLCLGSVDGRSGQAGIQSCEHNLLELAAYFWGIPYHGYLDGLGGVGDAAWRRKYLKTEAWTLVGPGLPRIPCSRAAALAELEQFANPETVKFYLGPRESRLVSPSKEVQSTHGDLKFLSLLLEHPGIAAAELNQRLGMNAGSHARVVRKNLRSSLTELTGQEETIRDNILCIPVLGAAALSCLPEDRS
jgi:hypothetical protein